MFINCHYDYRASTMHVWEYIKGERIYDKVIWVPYIYKKTVNSDIHTIDGKPVKKIEFRSYQDYYEYCKNADPYSILENKVKPEIQFLAERYHKIPDDELEVPKLLIYTIDIEVAAKQGFPDTSKPRDPVALISIRDSISKKTITFGTKKYTGQEENIFFRYCESEKEMLERFFSFVHKRSPDIYTGWNIWGFDLPYLINRSKYLFGEDTEIYQMLSPINIVKTWISDKYKDMNLDIGGVHILDYIDVYKWYSPTKLESYKLDFVSNHELEKGKLDYSEYKDIRELIEKDWNKFVDYNVTDVKRVDQLEDKLGYIKLIQALSLLTKCPMKYYQAMTSLIEGALITYYRRNNLCAPYFAGGRQVGFEAAYVKEPQKGMHNWVIDIDITSSYPSHIITLNMSNETFFGRIFDLPESEVIRGTRYRNMTSFSLSKDGQIEKFSGDRLRKFNLALKKGLFAIAPCGSVFKTNTPGVIAAVERQIFNKRKEVKGKMKELRTTASKLPDSKEKQKLEERSNELFALQWAIKILLNAMFGITSVPYSRYFNSNIAEAITSCGRHTIKQGEKFINEYLGENTDWIAYIDTDSLFIKLGEYLRERIPEWKNFTDEQKIKKILEFSKELEKNVNDKTFRETQLLDYNSQVQDFKIMFKQEIVAKTALFVKKKKYAYWCVNNEGVPADKLSVSGLEIVRSDSAEAIRTRLKHVYELIMKDADDDFLLKTIHSYRKELMLVTPEEIAANVSVNNIAKYVGDGEVMKGTPWHVKGVYNYRMMLKELNLVNSYEDVFEGTKGKVVYIKQNQYNLDTITFSRWPKEFDQFFVIDYERMIDNFFLKKIGFLLEPMNKKHLLEINQSETFDFFFKK